jgi:hypothetical protein
MDNFEHDLKRHLAQEAERVRSLPDDMARRVLGAVSRGESNLLRFAPVAVAALFVVGVGGALAASGLGTPHGPAGPPAVGAVSPSPAPSPEVSTTPAPSQSPQVPSVGDFSCAAVSGGSASAGGNLTAIRAGHQQGFDRVTFQFDGAAVPAYLVQPQGLPKFIQDASGKEVALQGQSGIKVRFSNASAQGTYTGSSDILLSPGGSILEVRNIGDFERVLSFGVGTAQRGSPCIAVKALSGPARLVVDVRVPAP